MVAIVELATHWSTVWATIKSVASDVGSFLSNLFHNSIVQDILAIWSLGLIPLAEHWTTVWNAIKTVVSGVATFFTTAWTAITSGDQNRVERDHLLLHERVERDRHRVQNGHIRG